MSFWNRLVDRFRSGTDGQIDWEAALIEADLGVTLATAWMEEEDGEAEEVRRGLEDLEVVEDILWEELHAGPDET